jgi:hypothetical protein
LIKRNSNTSITKHDQFDHENKTWERSLDFFKQENAFLKTHLSVVTDSKDEEEFVKLAEYFQNQFLLKDEFIKGLKIDITKQKDEIKRHFKKGKIPTDILNRQETLRKEVSYFETDFSRLKSEFHQLVTQFL